MPTNPRYLTRNCPFHNGIPHDRRVRGLQLAPTKTRLQLAPSAHIKAAAQEPSKLEPVMAGSAGIHHVTAICGDPRKNVAFYTRNLGLRMVKKTVNFDDPSTWHLYYGDETGRPGTALTFFAWGELPPGRNGNGMAVETTFVIPESSLGFWTQRLVALGISHDAPEKRFGETVLPLRDPDGMRLALVAVNGADALAGWSNGDVPAEHAIRGFHGVTLLVEADAATASDAHRRARLQRPPREGNLRRFLGAQKLGAVVDIRAAGRLSRRPPGRRLRSPCRVPGGRRCRPGRHGEGAVKAQRPSADRSDRPLLFPLGLFPRARWRPVRDRHRRSRASPSMSRAKLGHGVKLPPWYEPKRAEIVAALPPLT